MFPMRQRLAVDQHLAGHRHARRPLVAATRCRDTPVSNANRHAASHDARPRCLLAVLKLAACTNHRLQRLVADSTVTPLPSIRRDGVVRRSLLVCLGVRVVHRRQVFACHPHDCRSISHVVPWARRHVTSRPDVRKSAYRRGASRRTFSASASMNLRGRSRPRGTSRAECLRRARRRPRGARSKLERNRPGLISLVAGRPLFWHEANRPRRQRRSVDRHHVRSPA